MCLLTFIPDYVSPDMDRFKVAAQANPDGFGFAISTGKSIVTCHSMNFDEVANKFIDLRPTHNGPAIFHFRWATHGSETVSNCHPFFLGRDNQSVVGHNGILPVAIPKGDVRSDTKVFAQDIMPSVGGILSLDDDEYFKKLEAWSKGSKLVFLTNHEDAKQDFYILNEKDGHWDKDMWWSNHSYEAVTYKTYTSSSYSSRGSIWGYDDWDYGYGKTTYVSSWDKTHDSGLLVPDYDDELDYLAEEQAQQFDVFTTHIDDTTQLIECYNCAHAHKTPAGVLETHCDECGSCHYCGADYPCACWSAIYQVYDLEGFNYDIYAANAVVVPANPQSQSTTHPSYY
jgi:predicted glutamine amidotransferase